VLIKRDSTGKVSGLVLKQPEGEFAFKRVAEFAAPIGVDELMTKTVAAHGGEAALRKHKSLVTTYTLDFVNQGVGGEGSSSSRAPNSTAQSLTFVALGKRLGTLREFFDGASGGGETSFSLPDVKSAKQIEAARVQSDFYALPNWKTLFKSVVVKKLDKVDGEDVYVVVMTPERGNPITDYISTKSFLILKRETFNESDDEDEAGIMTETFGDYRLTDGVMLPFKTVQQSPGFGLIIMQVKDAKFDVTLPDSLFQAQAK
jgi:outer membrane lipoprotein-sorting protein